MRLRGLGAGVAILLLLGACGHGGESGAVPAESNPAAEPAAPAPKSVLPTTGSKSDSDLGSPRQDAQRLKKAATSVRKKAYFTLPHLVGRNLQAAQDTLQARGSYLLSEQDATGAARIQLLDRDWKVCSQDPEPGHKVLITTRVILKSVKLSETCP